MNNFRFRITQFRNSYMYFIIEMRGYKYPGKFDSGFDGITSLIKFLRNVSENKEAAYENVTPLVEHVLKYSPKGINSGRLKLMDYYYHYYDGAEEFYYERPGVFCEINISRFLLVNEIFMELKKLYRSAEFNAYQIEEEQYYYHYPVWDVVSAKVIEEYLGYK